MTDCHASQDSHSRPNPTIIANNDFSGKFPPTTSPPRSDTQFMLARDDVDVGADLDMIPDCNEAAVEGCQTIRMSWMFCMQVWVNRWMYWKLA